jgi:[ribosomal protein S5]-alanine N-acetyltransferase
MRLVVDDACVIENLRHEDAPFLFELMCREETKRYIPQDINTLDEMEIVVDWIISNYKKMSDRVTYMIRYRGADAGIVSYGPMPYDRSKMEVSYVIDPAFWRKGIGYSATRRFIEWLRGERGVGDLYAEVEVRNAGSIRILEKNGFSRQLQFTDSRTKREKYLYWLRPLGRE